MKQPTRTARALGVPWLCTIALGAMMAVSPLAAAQSLKPARLASASGVASPITANILIGKYLGYYKEEGLEFDLATLGARGQVAVINGLTRGDAEFGAGSAETLFNIENQLGIDVTAVYVYTRAHPEMIVVPADSTIKTLVDLKGKKVGVREMNRDTYPKAILDAAGIDPKSVEFLPVGIGAGPHVALQKGSVDALSLFDIDLKRVETLGAKLRYLDLPDAWTQMQGPLLYTRTELVKKDPKLMIGFGRAVAKSTLFTITNPEAAIRIFYKMYPQAVPKGRTFEEAVKNETSVLLARVPRLTIADRKTKKWGYMEPDAWKAEARLMGYDGKLKRKLADFYTNQFIDEINKFDQEAIVRQAKTFKIN